MFGSREEAETYANNCRIRRGNEGAGAFGNEELARRGKTVQDAVAFYLAHLRQQEQSCAVAEALEELLTVRAASGRSRQYCRDIRNRVGRFIADHPERTVASVTGKDLDEWLAGLPVAPGTRNTFRRDLRTLFSFCVKRGYCAGNPAADAEMARQADAPPGILTVPEAVHLLWACPSDMRAYVAVGLFAGLRAAELGKLDWSEVDLGAGLIEVKAHKAKTARRRLVRIAPNLAAWLAPLAREVGPVAPLALRYRWDDAKEAAGYSEARPWPSNALRHSFGSYWLAQHQDAAALALQMGNSPAMVFGHYRELVRPAEAAKFWALTP